MHKNNYKSVIGHTMYRNVICDDNIKGGMKLQRGKVLYATKVKLVSIQTRYKLRILNVIPFVTTKEISKYLKIYTKEMRRK